MHPTALRILWTLQTSSQELYTQELAAELDISRHTASKYLGILEATGLATHREVGNAKMWTPVSDRERPPANAKTNGKTSEAESPTPVFEEEHPPFSDEAAVVEAKRCLQCGGPLEPAPCIEACPTNIDVPTFIEEIGEGRPLEAADTILASNLLGGSCARVCPVEELCEGACVLDEEGRKPIAIGKLQRHATDKALLDEDSTSKEIPSPTRSERIGIIGAGPAGLACAGRLAERGYPIAVYEQKSLPGGLITHAIAPYKQHIEPLLEEFDRLDSPAITFHFDTTVGEDVSVQTLQEEHDAVFMGAGMGRDYQTDLPGEELPGVWDSLDFIEALKLGPFPEREVSGRVMVIGGGNTAIDVAREAARLGADAQIVYRRNEEQMPAYPHEVEAARQDGVEFEWLANPRRYYGNDRVEGVQCIRIELGEPDDSGRPHPEPIPGSEFVIEANTVVKAIGQRPWEDLLSVLDVETEWGRVEANERGETSRTGVFAGGDCVNGGATVVEAVQDGKRAAEQIDRYLTGSALAGSREEGEIERTEDEDGGEEGRASLLREEGEEPIRRYYQGDQFVGIDRDACKGCDLCLTSCPADILRLDDRDRIVVEEIGDCIFCGLCEARCPDFAIWVEHDGALTLNTDPFEHTLEVQS